MRQYALLFSMLMIAGCASILQPGLQERDLYVINTPEFPDNRVYYLGDFDSKNYRTVLHSQFAATGMSSAADPAHGDPISIILNSASLPISITTDQSLPFMRERLTRDIAVVLDVSAENQGGSQSIVAWYQRGVHPGQTLNFSNLLVFHQDNWDESVPPLIRIRILDVAAEANLETRETLSEVSKYGGAVALALQNPTLSPIIDAATRAASLILANRENKVVLDYSVQFYKSAEGPAPGVSILTPLKTGRFVLLGRAKESLPDRKYWSNLFMYDELNGDVVDQGGSAINTPVVVMTVNKESLIVPQFVAAKSAYLTRLLVEATSRNLDLIQEESDDLHARVSIYVLRERLRRYRTKGDLDKLVTYIETSEILPGDAVDSTIRMLAQIANCYRLSKDNLSPWWQANQNSVHFVEKKFQLDGVDCSATLE